MDEAKALIVIFILVSLIGGYLALSLVIFLRPSILYGKRRISSDEEGGEKPEFEQQVNAHQPVAEYTVEVSDDGVYVVCQRNKSADECADESTPALSEVLDAGNLPCSIEDHEHVNFGELLIRSKKVLTIIQIGDLKCEDLEKGADESTPALSEVLDAGNLPCSIEDHEHVNFEDVLMKSKKVPTIIQVGDLKCEDLEKVHYFISKHARSRSMIWGSTSQKTRQELSHLDGSMLVYRRADWKLYLYYFIGFLPFVSFEKSVIIISHSFTQKVDEHGSLPRFSKLRQWLSNMFLRSLGPMITHLRKRDIKTYLICSTGNPDNEKTPSSVALVIDKASDDFTKNLLLDVAVSDSPEHSFTPNFETPESNSPERGLRDPNDSLLLSTPIIVPSTTNVSNKYEKKPAGFTKNIDKQALSAQCFPSGASQVSSSTAIGKASETGRQYSGDTASQSPERKPLVDIHALSEQFQPTTVRGKALETRRQYSDDKASSAPERKPLVDIHALSERFQPSTGIGKALETRTQYSDDAASQSPERLHPIHSHESRVPRFSSSMRQTASSAKHEALDFRWQHFDVTAPLSHDKLSALNYPSYSRNNSAPSGIDSTLTPPKSLSAVTSEGSFRTARTSVSSDPDIYVDAELPPTPELSPESDTTPKIDTISKSQTKTDDDPIGKTDNPGESLEKNIPDETVAEGKEKHSKKKSRMKNIFSWRKSKETPDISLPQVSEETTHDVNVDACVSLDSGDVSNDPKHDGTGETVSTSGCGSPVEMEPSVMKTPEQRTVTVLKSFSETDTGLTGHKSDTHSVSGIPPKPDTFSKSVTYSGSGKSPVSELTPTSESQTKTDDDWIGKTAPTKSDDDNPGESTSIVKEIHDETVADCKDKHSKKKSGLKKIFSWRKSKEIPDISLSQVSEETKQDVKGDASVSLDSGDVSNDPKDGGTSETVSTSECGSPVEMEPSVMKTPEQRTVTVLKSFSETDTGLTGHKSDTHSVSGIPPKPDTFSKSVTYSGSGKSPVSELTPTSESQTKTDDDWIGKTAPTKSDDDNPGESTSIVKEIHDETVADCKDKHSKKKSGLKKIFSWRKSKEIPDISLSQVSEETKQDVKGDASVSLDSGDVSNDPKDGGTSETVSTSECGSPVEMEPSVMKTPEQRTVTVLKSFSETDTGLTGYKSDTHSVSGIPPKPDTFSKSVTYSGSGKSPVSELTPTSESQTKTDDDWIGKTAPTKSDDDNPGESTSIVKEIHDETVADCKDKHSKKKSGLKKIFSWRKSKEIPDISLSQVSEETKQDVKGDASVSLDSGDVSNDPKDGGTSETVSTSECGSPGDQEPSTMKTSEQKKVSVLKRVQDADAGHAIHKSDTCSVSGITKPKPVTLSEPDTNSKSLTFSGSGKSPVSEIAPMSESQTKNDDDQVGKTAPTQSDEDNTSESIVKDVPDDTVDEGKEKHRKKKSGIKKLFKRKKSKEGLCIPLDQETGVNIHYAVYGISLVHASDDPRVDNTEDKLSTLVPDSPVNTSPESRTTPKQVSVPISESTTGADTHPKSIIGSKNVTSLKSGKFKR